MCGIFGQATNSPKKIDDAKIKLLGMYNETRGKSSCGITYDGELYHGMDKEKLFSDFIKGRSFKARTIPVVFGHTRQASNGAINEFNCHPFGFGVNKSGDGYKFIMCHNGTLLNHKEIAKEFGVEDSAKYRNSHNVEMTRFKIDSELLGEILYETGNFKVLNKYNGRAALVWTDTDRPNVVYLWSGKSKPRINDTYDKAEEERPLNVWIENKNSFFFSSLPDALSAIGANDKDVFQIEYNTVYVVTDGNFAAAKKIHVSRRDNFHVESYGNYGSYGRDNEYNYINGYFSNRNQSSSTVPQRNEAFPKLDKENKALIQLPLPVINNIYDDRQLHAQNDYKGRVYPKQLRFWQNGHTIEGIYIWIPDYGYYHLASNEIDAEARVIKYAGIPFLNGDFDLHLKSKPGEGKIVVKDVNVLPKFYYFIEGVPMELPADYKRCMELKKSLAKGVWLDYKVLSFASLVPVVQADWAMKSVKEQAVLKDGELFSGSTDFLGFEKLYHFKNGNLDYTCNKKNPQVCITSKSNLLEPTNNTNYGTNSKVRQLEIPLEEKYNPEILEKAYNNICALENRINESELENEVNNNIDQSFLGEDNLLPDSDINGDFLNILDMNKDIKKQDDTKFLENLKHEDQAADDNEIDEQIQCIINENLAEPLQRFQETKKDLEKHLPHPFAKEAIKMIEDMTLLLKTYIL